MHASNETTSHGIGCSNHCGTYYLHFSEIRVRNADKIAATCTALIKTSYDTVPFVGIEKADISSPSNVSKATFLSMPPA